MGRMGRVQRELIIVLEFRISNALLKLTSGQCAMSACWCSGLHPLHIGNLAISVHFTYLAHECGRNSDCSCPSVSLFVFHSSYDCERVGSFVVKMFHVQVIIH